MDDIQQQVNEEEIATFYNKVEEIWPSNEPWYKYTKAQIEKFVHKNAFKYHDYVLNAGSGGYDLYMNIERMWFKNYIYTQISHIFCFNA